MTNLATDLRNFDPGWDRETLDLGAEYLFSPNLSFDVDWRYQTKEGKGQTWGTFLGGATELIQPLNYETNEVEGGINYTAERWQVRLAYLGSWFSNKDLSLQWENAFTGPDQGRMAQAPDNKSYNVSLSGAYQHHAAHHRLGDRLARSVRAGRQLPAIHHQPGPGRDAAAAEFLRRQGGPDPIQPACDLRGMVASPADRRFPLQRTRKQESA